MNTNKLINIGIFILIALLLYLFIIYYEPAPSPKIYKVAYDLQDNETVYVEVDSDKINQLKNLSLKNNIIIDDATLKELKDYMSSHLPNESIIMIFGEYNKERGYILITQFEPIIVNIATESFASYNFTQPSKEGYIGKVHNHPSGLDESGRQKVINCLLSPVDIKSYNNNKLVEDEILGIMCNSLNLMILSVPKNLTDFEEYTIYQEN